MSDTPRKSKRTKKDFMASSMKLMITTSLHLRKKKPSKNMKRKHSLRKSQLKQ